MMNFKQLLRHPPEFFYEGSSKALSVSNDDIFANIKPSFDYTPENESKLKSALEFISADCDRDSWLNVVFAIHSTGWKNAKTIARDWSLTAPELFNEKHFTRDWDSAKADKSGGITINTLFKMAITGGWTDKTRVNKIFDDHGDVAIARRFVDEFTGTFLNVWSLKDYWLIWDGVRYKTCTGEPLQAVIKVAEKALHDAIDALKNDDSKHNHQNYTNARSFHRNIDKKGKAALNIAANLPGMSISNPSELDANPYLIATRNVTVDLKTGAALTPNPKMMCSKLAGASYDIQAECPMWLEFLDQIFCGDAELIAFIQRLLGYTLVGEVNEEILVFLYGDGANGKSIFNNIVMGVFGEYASTVGVELLMDSKSNAEGKYYKPMLAGARYVSANETGVGDIFDDKTIKDIASVDSIAARPIYGSPFSFKPTHKLWLRGNHKPAIKDVGDGFWRRLILIPFKRKFNESERVYNLDKKILESERDGIFNWMLQGCMDWQKNKLKIPKIILLETNKYRRETDVLGEWIDECCIKLPHARISATEAYKSYKKHLEENGFHSISSRTFYKMLENKGYEKKHSNGSYFSGLRIKSPFGEDDL